MTPRDDDLTGRDDDLRTGDSDPGTRDDALGGPDEDLGTRDDVPGGRDDDLGARDEGSADVGRPDESVAGSDSQPEGTDEALRGEPLVPRDAAVDFKARWEVIQQGFVDDPRSAVTDADRLVTDVLKRLSVTFEEQHHDLERQWSDGEPSTEDLRGALQRYRAFFQRLLTI